MNAHRRHSQPKRIRVTLWNPETREAVGSADIPLPDDFTNFNVAHGYHLLIEQQVKLPEGFPMTCYPDDPLPETRNPDGQVMPWYPYSFTLSEDGYATQAERYALSTSSVVMFVDFQP